MNVEKRTLKLLAAFVWYTGFMALSIKATLLFLKAYTLNDSTLILIGILLFSIIIIYFKVKYIFSKVCRKNLIRIEALKSPKFWEFYRIRFFVFLISMITLGAFLSRMAEGNYWFLMGVGVVDISVGLSLFFSGFLFWEK
jgi:hypothetical protein